MAFWQRKDGTKVCVYYWCGATGKQRLIPRSQTRHLDGRSDLAIKEWVECWEAENQPIHRSVFPTLDPTTVDLVERFCRYQLEGYGRHPYTVQAHSRNLLSIALPYFVNQHQIQNLSEMRLHSPRLSIFLRDGLEFEAPRIRHIQMSLRMFWKWLEEEGVVEGRLILRRTMQIIKETPLKIIPTPEQILSWESSHEDLKLLMLLCYFFSLRPQEALALTVKDFIAGERASEQEACRVMRRAKLFDRLIVRITHQRSRSIGLSPPKAGSKGFVACFHSQAAERIVAILRSRGADKELFPFGNDWYFKRWRREGYPQLTLKDCRRASLYWLGHYSDLEIVALRNHARHADIKTTALYTRRPLDSCDFEASLDLY